MKCLPGCTCRKHRAWRHSPETRAKIAAAHRARSTEKRAAMRGAGNPMFGRTHSAEARQKISAANFRGGCYTTAHARVRQGRGPATEHRCVECEEHDATDWAYLGGAPDEAPSVNGPYSLDPSFYAPMCRPCHKRFDLERP